MNISDSTLEKVTVVDENDRELRVIERRQATNKDILRVTGIFLTNKEGEILLQLRSNESYRYPSHWDCSAGGHVDTREKYEESALREMKEEIGVESSLDFLGKKFVQLDDGRKHFIAFFKGTHTGRIVIDQNEVTLTKWCSQEKIKNMINQGEKFHPECLIGLREYFSV